MRMNKRARVLVSAAVAVMLLAGSGATAYASHYQDLALPGSSVAGISATGLSRAELASAIDQRAQDVRVTVTTPTGVRTSTLAELGLTVDTTATVERVFDANKQWSSYATALVSSRTVEPVVVNDVDVQDAYATALAATFGTPATNGAVTLADDQASFVGSVAATGTSVDQASLQDVAAEAARTLTSASTTARFVDLAPTVTTEAAQAIADQANALVALPVTLTAGDTTFTATAADKASWITIPVTDDAPGTPSYESAKVSDWVNAQAATLTVEPTTGVRNVSSTGTVLSVVKDASDGRSVSNAAELATSAAQALASGTQFAGSFATATVAATWNERRIAAGAENLAYPAAEGEKWVDVNLSNYTMTAYEGGQAVIGPVAMVDGAEATPTVVGTFKIYSKQASMTMRGPNADGTTYETPNVPWVAFFHRGYALHGAYWRSTFGYSGSHGCINLPVATAQQVFEWAPIGTTVVTHH